MKEEGRWYYVSIGDLESEWTSMTCGVPQGSILGPFLVNLYAPNEPNNEKEPNVLQTRHSST